MYVCIYIYTGSKCLRLFQCTFILISASRHFRWTDLSKKISIFQFSILKKAMLTLFFIEKNILMLYFMVSSISQTIQMLYIVQYCKRYDLVKFLHVFSTEKLPKLRIQAHFLKKVSQELGWRQQLCVQISESIFTWCVQKYHKFEFLYRFCYVLVVGRIRPTPLF